MLFQGKEDEGDGRYHQGSREEVGGEREREVHCYHLRCSKIKFF